MLIISHIYQSKLIIPCEEAPMFTFTAVIYLSELSAHLLGISAKVIKYMI
jgi:hypothetical protein